jgi:hypothetical protein
MNNTTMHIMSLGAFGLAGLLALAFGVRYLVTREFMPYHATVLGTPWAALEPRLQAIILGMLKVAGGGLLGCGSALLWLLVPLQRGEAWAVWAAITVIIALAAPVLHVVLWLRRVSPGARTPVIPTVATLVLVAVGTILFLAGRP